MAQKALCWGCWGCGDDTGGNVRLLPSSQVKGNWRYQPQRLGIFCRVVGSQIPPRRRDKRRSGHAGKALLKGARGVGQGAVQGGGAGSTRLRSLVDLVEEPGRPGRGAWSTWSRRKEGAWPTGRCDTHLSARLQLTGSPVRRVSRGHHSPIFEVHERLAFREPVDATGKGWRRLCCRRVLRLRRHGLEHRQAAAWFQLPCGRKSVLQMMHFGITGRACLRCLMTARTIFVWLSR